MFFSTNFFEHLRYFTRTANSRGAAGEFKLGSMDATVRLADREVEFRAQYMIRRPDGSLTYTMQFDDGAQGFVGWLPYFNKRWPEAVEKIAFKTRVATAGLPTPLWSTGTVSAELGDFVIKRVKGSLGQGMRGPFKAAAAGSTVLGEDEFAERYFLGPIGKAWYWNDRVLTLELQDPPTVTGDGLATIAELVKRGSRRAQVEDETDFSRYRGFRWSDTPARGERVIVDFRYGSLCYPFHYASLDRYEELKDGPVVAKLNEWGPVFWSFIPETIRQGTLYSVDFVIARDGGIRLLEMNCNPVVPPEAYETIFDSLFGDMTDVRATAAAIASGRAGMLIPPLPPRPKAVEAPSMTSGDARTPSPQ
jgi:hypothetical protein